MTVRIDSLKCHLHSCKLPPVSGTERDGRARLSKEATISCRSSRVLTAPAGGPAPAATRPQCGVRRNRRMEFSELLFDADSDDYLVDDSPSDLVREALEGGVVDDGYEDEFWYTAIALQKY
ncbi:hypothetical protein FOCC_FOCC008371 [Frankliniella occidentalis]|nr:hypothetical protein FOCC_FOCC008371 [Frankliniella occidentalis]